jgi:hypothetical protein
MITFREYLAENPCPVADAPITRQQLVVLEKWLDKMFAALGIDIAFTRHFLDRLNDPRNVRQIGMCELQKIFTDTFRKHGQALKKMGQREIEAVLADLTTNINIPFVLKFDPRQRELVLVNKTIMRKKNFMTPDRKLTV